MENLKFLILLFLAIFITFSLGMLLSKINNASKNIIIKRLGWIPFCFISLIGTVIHELSHLFIGLLFLHFPTKIELFRPIKGKKDNIMGLVEQKYKNTLYRKIGKFFIGIAPMIVGTFFIFFMFCLLININISDIEFVFNKSFFSLININRKSPITYFLIFSIISVSLNMNMSLIDIKNSVTGAMFLIIFNILLLIVLNLFNLINIVVICFYIEKFVYLYFIFLLIGLILSFVLFLFFSLFDIILK